MILRVLSRQDVDELAGQKSLAYVMADAFRAFSGGETCTPPRTEIPIDSKTTAFVMPSYLTGAGTVGLKLGIWRPGQGEGDLPPAFILLVDPDGSTEAGLVDARSLIALRTSLASVVALELLANPDARDLALIGAGHQGRAHVLEIHRHRPLRRVRIFSRTQANAVALRNELRHLLGCEISVELTAELAVSQSNLVVVATDSLQPVVDVGHLQPGSHVCAVGSFRPDGRELDVPRIANRRVFADSIPDVARRAGDFQIPADGDETLARALIDGEIGQILNGTVAGRENASQITVYKSVGLAAQDVALGRVLLDHAQAAGLGAQVPLG